MLSIAHLPGDVAVLHAVHTFLLLCNRIKASGIKRFALCGVLGINPATSFAADFETDPLACNKDQPESNLPYMKCLAVGTGSYAGAGSVALGNNAKSDKNSVAVGMNAEARSGSAVLGANAKNTGSMDHDIGGSSVVIGEGAEVAGSSGIAIGDGSRTLTSEVCQRRAF